MVPSGSSPGSTRARAPVARMMWRASTVSASPPSFATSSAPGPASRPRPSMTVTLFFFIR